MNLPFRRECKHLSATDALGSAEPVMGHYAPIVCGGEGSGPLPAARTAATLQAQI